MVKRSRLVAFFLIVLLIGGIIGATTNKVTKGINLGLDLRGGFEILYEVHPAKKGDKITRDVLVSTVHALENRVNVLGVSEPNIQIEGTDRIRVQLAGVQDQSKAREILSTQAKLTFRDVNDNILMDGTDLKQNGAKQTFDEQGRPSVGLALKSADKFSAVTKKVMDMGAPNNLMVIWLDFEEGKDSYKAEAAKAKPKYLSAASVNQVFNQADVSIVGGNFTVESAKQLANLLNAGALPVDLKEMYSTSVGAKFGETALQKTVLAGAIGIALIFLFMLAWYHLPGIVAIVMLCLYTYITLLIFDWMGAVLTLPGIAALVLGVGIAVDANIITDERFKEELKIGKSVMAAYRAGNKHSFLTVLDAHVTTLLAAVVLFIYGTSSVKGFATSLIISLVVGFATNVGGTRFLLGLLVKSRMFDKKPEWFGVKKKDIIHISKGVERAPTKFDRIDFVKVGRRFVAFSIAATLAGVIALATMGMNVGIDFSSGARIDVSSSQAIDLAELRKDLVAAGVKADEIKDIVHTGSDNKGAAIRTIGVLSKDEIATLKSAVKQKYGAEPNVSTVSPTIGKELARNAFIAVMIASVGIILYVSLRFRFTYAVSAVVALLHDAFFIIAVFSLLQLEVDITFIAAVLTIVGYSINDSIVTFDRNRELYKGRKIRTRQDLEDVVNISIRETLTRSINTVMTVLLPVIALLIFGSGSLRNFSIALLVGLIVGTYSSIFIASQLWLALETRRLKKGKAKPATAVTSDEPQV
ncbi:protein translocase subunit SecDF [Ectobacillus ponti]|uniref:Multifunctional fusion protein n=1 Tax=Ectobacillus ponti TaxID=2961894 RepID=A0AA42BRD5_9BACI|nr:protein translocase subunit SecDF [Ectobacillus ponti]MCP8967288.1 protein translocase subunit SecDF [Ectobacillus ponti]